MRDPAAHSTLSHMSYARLAAIAALGLAACGGEYNPENSMQCGLQAIASANRVLERFQTGSSLMGTAPVEMRGTVPARVVGHGSGRALVAEGPNGVVAGFEGEGFPMRPGFAVALVDDSLEVFRGILIYEADGPADYPQIGTVSGEQMTIPLYAMRAPWSHISTEDCPLFRIPADTATR